jgi:hypothetical protein
MKKTVTIAIAALISIIAVTAYLNRSYIVDKRAMVDNAVLSVMADGEAEGILDLVFIKSLGEEDFTANLKSSGKDAVKHSYTGVPLKNVFEAFNIDIENRKQVVVRAVDGYTVALTMKEVLDNKNTYIAYKRNGENLGRKETGGSGPYQLIIRKDPFSQRWCKYVVEVEVQ